MKEISFNEFFLDVWNIAQRMNLNQTEFLEKCGFPKQRFNNWVTGKQNLTGRNFIKLLERVGMDCQKFEKTTKRVFSTEQIEECELRKFEKNHRGLLLKLARDASLVKKLSVELGG